MFVLNVQSLPLRGQGLSINRSNFATFCDVLRIRLVIWVWSFPGGEWECIALLFVYLSISTVPGADPGFQIRGEHLKKLRLAEGGAKIVGVFRVKNHDFTPKNHFFSNFRGARTGCAPSLDLPLCSSTCFYLRCPTFVPILKSSSTVSKLTFIVTFFIAHLVKDPCDRYLSIGVCPSYVVVFHT